MIGHDSIRRNLALAAAAALESTELRAVEQHVAECADCRAEFDRWITCADSLRALPQPVVPSGLVERTEARMVYAPASARRNEAGLAALALFGWVLSLTFWFAIGLFAKGAWMLPDGSIRTALEWSLLSNALAWITAGPAAAILANRRKVRRLA